jgi:predicted aldo/keto reductase-like oxidoreductase
MPCPQGVSIPDCFAAYNASYAIGYISGLTLYVTSTGLNHPEKNHSGKGCVKCGACEQKCPQQIKISNSLTAVTKRMEPFWFRAVMRVVQMIAK